MPFRNFHLIICVNKYDTSLANYKGYMIYFDIRYVSKQMTSSISKHGHISIKHPITQINAPNTIVTEKQFLIYAH